MTKSLSGTNDTGRGHGCPCGRSHPDARNARRRRRRGGDLAEMADVITEAYASSKASGDPQRGEHRLHFAGDCEAPVVIRQSASRGALFASYETRCRKCGPCRRAKVAYWALAAVEQTRLAREQGRRTWFGTLTLSPEWRAAVEARAFDKWLAGSSGTGEVPDWWTDPKCDYRFGFIRTELVREVQLYWKRLRKAGHRFRYLLVFERHKSGHPHMHWLLHEEADPILKRHLQGEWFLGFTNVKLVSGNSRQSASETRAAWYVAKYLGKTIQSRQIASRLYRPSRSRM